MDRYAIALRYMFNNVELKTKQDLIDRREELTAYAILDGQSFDFGTGMITNSLSFGSEDFYLDHDLKMLEWLINEWDDYTPNRKALDIDELEQCHEYWYPPIKHNRKQRDNKYARNRKHKDDLWSAVERKFYPVYIPWNSKANNAGYPKREYRGSRSAYLKKQSSKRIRIYKGELPKKGNAHRRVFDFWWELY